MNKSLKYLNEFARKKARGILENKPLKVVLVDLPTMKTYQVVARGAIYMFTPDDKRYKSYIHSYEIMIDRDYYLESSIKELEQSIIHEIAHLKLKGEHRDRGHGKDFKRVAKSLGSDPTHLKQYWV